VVGGGVAEGGVGGFIGTSDMSAMICFPQVSGDVCGLFSFKMDGMDGMDG